MKAYRIGRVDLPWLNLTPPIRAGLITIRSDAMGACETKEKEALLNNIDLPFSATRSPTIHSGQELNEKDVERAAVSCSGSDDEDCTRRSVLENPSRHSSQSHKKDQSVKEASQKQKLSELEAYTVTLEQSEIEQGIRDYPSLDHATQDAIAIDYRALHDQVKAQGLYQCRYSEYGKELIRYSILFGIFVMLLRCHWYLTSAVALGIFWVSTAALSTISIQDADQAYSNKSCSRLTTQAIVASRATLSLIL